jgi:hypothetical protein
MNCQKFHEQLDAALDQRRFVSSQTGSVGDADLVAHAESCADCRVLYEEHVLIETALAAWTPLRPAVDLTDKVIEVARKEGLISSNTSAIAVSSDAKARELSSDNSPYVMVSAGPSDDSFDFLHRRSTILAMATTAVLLLIAAFIVFRDGQNQLAKDQQPAQQLFPDRQPEQLDEPQDQLADIGHLVADAQSAWQGITRRVSHQASGLSVFVPDLKTELGISDTAGSFEMIPDDPNPDGGSIMRKATQPSAVEKAFEFLFDDDESAGTQTI